MAVESAAPVRSVLFIAETTEALTILADGQTVGTLFAAALPEASLQMSAVRRLFEALRPAKTTRQPREISAGSINDTAQTIVVADADPYFSRWQKDATERLNQEKAITVRGEHRVASLHPDSFVVVCEAGCRSNVGEVVYIVSKAAAGAAKPAKPGAATLETTAASGSKSPVNGDASTTPERPAEPVAAETLKDESKDLPCVAGCYDRPQQRSPSDNRRAEMPVQRLAETDPSRLLPAAATASIAKAMPLAAIAKQPVTKMRSAQIGRNGAIVNAEAVQPRRAESLKIARAVIARLQTPKSWRTTIQRSTTPASVAPQLFTKSSSNRPRRTTRDIRASSAQMAKIRRAVARLH